jgi:hypothetical protein
LITAYIYGGDGGSPITHYAIEWDTKADFSSPAQLTIVKPDVNVYRLGGRDPIKGGESSLLLKGGIYYARIIPFNAVGSGLPQSFLFLETGSSRIGPLQDQASDPPDDVSFELSPMNVMSSLNLKWSLPLSDGGSPISEFIVELDESNQFESAQVLHIPIIREMQTIAIETDTKIEVQSVVAAITVRNEVQSIQTEAVGINEVQMITTVADEVKKFKLFRCQRLM